MKAAAPMSHALEVPTPSAERVHTPSTPTLFFSSPSGRIATATLAAGLAGASLLTYMDDPLTLVLPLVVLACIVGSVFATGLAIDRFPAEAMAMILVLPFVAGFYFAGLHLVIGQGGSVGLPLSGAALLLFGFAAGAPSIFHNPRR